MIWKTSTAILEQLRAVTASLNEVRRNQLNLELRIKRIHDSHAIALKQRDLQYNHLLQQFVTIATTSLTNKVLNQEPAKQQSIHNELAMFAELPTGSDDGYQDDELNLYGYQESPKSVAEVSDDR